MDVKTIGLIFLGSILIQASFFGVVADKVPDKDGEVTKLGKEGNHLMETAAVRALSLNNVILKKRWTREENKNKKISKKLVIEEIPHLDDLSDLIDEINDRFTIVEKRLVALEKQPPESITPTPINPITGKTFVTPMDPYVPEYPIYGNWADAREVCKKKGGDLATNLSEEDLKFIFNEEGIVPDDERGLWVGARANESATEENYEDSFEWLDGTKISARDPLWGLNFGFDQKKKCVVIWRKSYYRSEYNTKTEGPTYEAYECSYPWRGILCEIPNNRHRYSAVESDLQSEQILD